MKKELRGLNYSAITHRLKRESIVYTNQYKIVIRHVTYLPPGVYFYQLTFVNVN